MPCAPTRYPDSIRHSDENGSGPGCIAEVPASINGVVDDVSSSEAHDLVDAYSHIFEESGPKSDNTRVFPDHTQLFANRTHMS
jgi:hypothetical protein